jgi:hypothetical protein
VIPQNGRTVARELTDAATSASDAVGRFADGLELGRLCGSISASLFGAEQCGGFQG